jgi:hypothetical protein
LAQPIAETRAGGFGFCRRDFQSPGTICHFQSPGDFVVANSSPGDFILYNKERFPHTTEIPPMYPSEEITLKAFLTALRQHNSPLPSDIQTRLHEIAKQLKISTISSVELEAIANLDPILHENYQKARSILQTDFIKSEHGKTDPMLPIPEASETELRNLSIAVFSSPNSVDSAKSLPKQGLLQRVFSLFKQP